MKRAAPLLPLATVMILCSVTLSRPPLPHAESRDTPLALKGFDPVALVGGKETPGEKDREKIHEGFRYRFANAANQAEFTAHPEKYAIQLHGQCVHMPRAKGDPDIFAVYKGRIYLGGTENCIEAFKASPEEELKKHDLARTVAILVFPGVQIIDFTGPYEVFGQGGYRVVTVAEKSDTLTTAMGLTITPTYSFADCPEADVLVLPGGNVVPNEAIRTWVRARAEKARYVLSVCNGAFFLADAGLLDGLSATTFAGLIDQLKKAAPKCRVVRDQRFVDNGKIITSAGLSSGIDGALHVIEKLKGKGFAQEVALGLEYHWQPDLPYARASFADRHIRAALGRRLSVPDGMKATVLRTDGGTDHWEKSWQVTGELEPEDLLKALDAKLAESWTRVDSGKTPEAGKRVWKFTDDEGHAWNGVAEASAKQDGVNLVLRIRRSDK